MKSLAEAGSSLWPQSWKLIWARAWCRKITKFQMKKRVKYISMKTDLNMNARCSNALPTG